MPFTFDELDQNDLVDITTSRLVCHWLLEISQRSAVFPWEKTGRLPVLKRSLHAVPQIQKLPLRLDASIHYK